MNEFNWIDILVIVLYFVGIIGYGVWLSNKIKNSDGYFRGERKFGWWIMMGQAFGTGTHAENFVAQTGASFHLGFAAIWYQWKNMIITPFYWLIAPWYRRSERTTVGEIVEDRYGKKMGLFYSVFAILFFIFIAKTYAKRKELLLVLKYPELPLHNNASELSARVQARARDVSLHTMSENGTKIKDTFMTVSQTAKKLKVRTYDYIRDRVSGEFKLPSLAQLIEEKSHGNFVSP